MQQHQADFRITCMARVLAVSRSGFYAWRQRAGQKTPSQLRRQLCESRVASAFVELEVDYNQKRRHSTLGYVSPMVFERQVLS